MKRKVQDRINRATIHLIRFYGAAVSPLFPPSCRFIPTCSEYAEEALDTHGWRRGMVLIIQRLGRCHPFGAHGYDPVPPEETRNVTSRR